MKLVELKNDVAFMTDDGLSYMAAIDCFESGNQAIGAYINNAGLPMLVMRNSIPGAKIQRLFKDPEFKRYIV